MSSTIIFLAGMLCLPLGAGITLLTVRIAQKILKSVKIRVSRKSLKVDPWRVGITAVQLATRPFFHVSLAGWQFVIIAPVSKVSKEEENKVGSAVGEVLAKRQPESKG